MNQYTYRDNEKTYQRVSKKTAQKLFNDGKEIVFCPSNLRPGYPYYPESHLDNHQGSVDFETAYNAFFYYHCDAASRYGINYFVEVES